MTFKDLFKDSNHGDSLFSEKEIAAVQKRIQQSNGKKGQTITCLVRNKDVPLKPEEAVRQLYLYRLLHTYGYPAERLHVEFSINFGREIKRADIAIMDRDRPTVPYVIVEVKKPKLKTTQRAVAGKSWTENGQE